MAGYLQPKARWAFLCSLGFHSLLCILLIGVGFSPSPAPVVSSQLSLVWISAPHGLDKGVSKKTRQSDNSLNKVVKKKILSELGGLKTKKEAGAEATQPQLAREITMGLEKSQGGESRSFSQHILKNQKPIYPHIALKRNWEGQVQLRLQVNAQGEVVAVQVKEACPYDVLNESAVSAAKSWQFKSSSNGEPYWVEKNVVFQIKRI